jgi:hypothetical protein
MTGCDLALLLRGFIETNVFKEAEFFLPPGIRDRYQLFRCKHAENVAQLEDLKARFLVVLQAGGEVNGDGKSSESSNAKKQHHHGKGADEKSRSPGVGKSDGEQGSGGDCGGDHVGAAWFLKDDLEEKLIELDKRILIVTLLLEEVVEQLSVMRRERDGAGKRNIKYNSAKVQQTETVTRHDQVSISKLFQYFLKNPSLSHHSRPQNPEGDLDDSGGYGAGF